METVHAPTATADHHHLRRDPTLDSAVIRLSTLEILDRLGLPPPRFIFLVENLSACRQHSCRTGPSSSPSSSSSSSSTDSSFALLPPPPRSLVSPARATATALLPPPVS
uniref:Uncharacterized protein n=1 Tax=Triticum urartu TaxID=4572 RepID=A0A8R7TC59_TRIUA